jgi:hypothetical protein
VGAGDRKQVFVGATLGATLSFLLARYVLRDLAARFISKHRVRGQLPALQPLQSIVLVGAGGGGGGGGGEAVASSALRRIRWRRASMTRWLRRACAWCCC